VSSVIFATIGSSALTNASTICRRALGLELAGATDRAAAQLRQQVACRLATLVTLTLQPRGEALLAEPAGVLRARVAAQERERDRAVDRPEHFASAGPQAPELLAQLVRQSDPSADEVLAGARQRPQRLRAVAVRSQDPEAVTVGPRQLGQHEAVKAVALAARGAIATSSTPSLISLEHNARIPRSSRR
jgi:hypothetical protein